MGLTGIVLVVLIVVGAVLLVHHDNGKSKGSSHGGKTPPTMAAIEITPNGFMPATLSISPNTDVVWINEDAAPHLPAADPYPTHRSLPALVAPRALGQKETYSFLFTKSGTVHYHDDIHPTWTGTVVVR
jgi:plastocyanin